MSDTATARRSPTGRRLAILLGLACVAGLGGAAVLRWPELQRAWYLARLRREPALFQDALTSTLPPLRDACRRYVQEPEGGRALVEAFVREIDACAWPTGRRGQSGVLDPLLEGPTDHIGLALRKDGAGHSYTCLSWRGTQGHSSFSMTANPGVPERRDVLLELLPLCSGKTYPLQWPVLVYGRAANELEVHVASAAAIRAATDAASGDDAAYLRGLGWPPLWGLGGLPRAAEYVLLIRRAP